jgi:hypothetical protein
VDYINVESVARHAAHEDEINASLRERAGGAMIYR